MPETNNLKNNRALEDKAWQDMLEQLDLNLPVSKGIVGRERLFLFVLLFLVISMASYIAFMHLSGPEIQNPPTQTHQDEYFAWHDQTGSAEDQPFPLNGAEIQKEEVVSHSVNNGSDGKGIQHKWSAPERNTDRKNLFASVPDAIKLQLSKTVTTEHSSVNEGIPISKSATGSLAELPIKGSITENLPVIPGLIVSYPADQTFPLPLIVSLDQPKPYCRHSIGWSAGVMSENMISFGGMESGFSYDYAVSRRIALRTGLKMQLFYKNGFANSLTLNSIMNNGKLSLNNSPDERWPEYRYQFDVDNEVIQNDELGVEYLTGIVDHLYYLSVPTEVVLKYKYLNLSAGANISVLVRGTNKIKDYSDQYFNTVILSNTALENRDYFNRLDLGFQVGFETKIWKNLSMYGSYNHGFLEILSTDSGKEINNGIKDAWESLYHKPIDQRVDYNRYLTLGIKYNLSACR